MNEITARLGQLSQEELKELALIIQGLLEALEEEKSLSKGGGGMQESKSKQRGHIELKRINGCGPYRYLRYWAGKRLKSVYLGKADGGS